MTRAPDWIGALISFGAAQISNQSSPFGPERARLNAHVRRDWQPKHIAHVFVGSVKLNATLAHEPTLRLRNIGAPRELDQERRAL